MVFVLRQRMKDFRLRDCLPCGCPCSYCCALYRFQIRSNDLLVLFWSRKFCNLEKTRLARIPNCFQRHIWRAPVLRHDTCLSVIRARLTWPLFSYNDNPFSKNNNEKTYQWLITLAVRQGKNFFLSFNLGWTLIRCCELAHQVTQNQQMTVNFHVVPAL